MQRERTGSELGPYFEGLQWFLNVYGQSQSSIPECLSYALAKDYRLLFEHGIPLVILPDKPRPEVNPMLVATTGLLCHSLYCSNQSPSAAKVLHSTAHWLMDNIHFSSDRKGGLGVWLYNYPWNPARGYRCTAPWASAVAQGLGISLLLRYNESFGDSRALDIAAMAYKSFQHPIEEGGVISRMADGGIKLEEYACPERGTPLNGWLSALLGLYDFARYTGDPVAQVLYIKALATVSKHIRSYDRRIMLFHWTRYDDKSQPFASRRYHRVHISQVRTLYFMTHQSEYLQLFRQWEIADGVVGPVVDLLQIPLLIGRALRRRVVIRRRTVI